MESRFIAATSDDSNASSISSVSTNKSAKYRGKYRKYYLSSEHESFTESQKFVVDEKIWTPLSAKSNTHYYS